MDARAWLLAAVLLALSPLSRAENIAYEIYALPTEKDRTLLAKGIREYSFSEVESYEHRLFGPRHWTKRLRIRDDFYIGGSIYREPKMAGFGLWIKRDPQWFEFWSDGGFSWEWFDYRQPDDVYRKLQGQGRVKVTMARVNGLEEIAAVEFLEDVTMRLTDRPWFLFSDRDTHHIVIAKGSVLRFAP
jgi:hypothetical protein